MAIKENTIKLLGYKCKIKKKKIVSCLFYHHNVQFLKTVLDET